MIVRKITKPMPGMPDSLPRLDADPDLQDHLLAGTSRTFALTIPQLPPPLARVVGNAYLLCRTVDTIEDEPALSLADKRYFCDLYVRALQGVEPPERFAAELAPRLSTVTLPSEAELVQATPRVLAMTRRFNPAQQRALRRCVTRMAEGMVEFQSRGSLDGLADLPQLDRYCYFVAGIVGEMLTELFCDYSPTIARRRQALMTLAVSFGQGLQMTNILKDLWDDRARGVCWLPRTAFAAPDFRLRELDPDHPHPIFDQGLERLIGIAHGHLRDALDYTLLIPRQETGIRIFCLWAIGMALLTLRKLNHHRDFSDGRQVKISRRGVAAVFTAGRLAAAHDTVLRRLFRLTGLGLPLTPG